MSQISLKSISGITSITTPTGVDNQLTLHTNNTNQAFKLDSAGNIHINNHVNTTGVTTATNFKTGSSNLHSAGVEVAGVNVNGADTPIGLGATIYNSGAAVFTGVVTATSFSGDGSNLSGLASRDFYGFEIINENLYVKFTNSGADNISLSENASFVEDFIGPTGYTFSINNAGELEMTI